VGISPSLISLGREKDTLLPFRFPNEEGSVRRLHEVNAHACAEYMLKGTAA
jgi:hypothetical protein